MYKVLLSFIMKCIYKEEKIEESEYNIFTILLMKTNQEHKKRKSNISTKKIFFAVFIVSMKRISGMMNICKVMYNYNFFHKHLLEDYLLFTITGI